MVLSNTTNDTSHAAMQSLHASINNKDLKFTLKSSSTLWHSKLTTLISQHLHIYQDTWAFDSIQYLESFTFQKYQVIDLDFY